MFDMDQTESVLFDPVTGREVARSSTILAALKDDWANFRVSTGTGTGIPESISLGYGTKASILLSEGLVARWPR